MTIAIAATGGNINAADANGWKFNVNPALKGGQPSIAGETAGEAKALEYEINKLLPYGTTESLTQAKLPASKSMKLTMPAVKEDTYMEVVVREQGTTVPLFKWHTLVVPEGKNIMNHQATKEFAAPADFKEYWDKAKKELADVKGDVVLTRMPEKDTTTGLFWRVDAPTVKETTVSAWYFVPKAAFDANGKVVKKFPAVQIMPGYGAGEPPADRTAEGFITLAVSPRLHGPSRDFWPGKEEPMLYNLYDPDNYYYKLAFLDGLKCIQFLFSRPEVDGARVATEGSSQGGLFAVSVAALEPRVSAVCSNVTAFSAYEDGLCLAEDGHHNQFARLYREEKDPAKKEAMHRSLSMTNGANMATMVKCPTQINMGDIDIVCPYPCGITVLNSLATKTREFHIYKNTPHAVPPEMRANNRAWLDKHFNLKGDKTGKAPAAEKKAAKAKVSAKKGTKKAKKQAAPTPCPCEKERY